MVLARGMSWRQKGMIVHFDLMTLFGVGVAVVAVVIIHRRARGGSGEVEPEHRNDERQDVLRALKSMRKD